MRLITCYQITCLRFCLEEKCAGFSGVVIARIKLERKKKYEKQSEKQSEKN